MEWGKLKDGGVVGWWGRGNTDGSVVRWWGCGYKVGRAWRGLMVGAWFDGGGVAIRWGMVGVGVNRMVGAWFDVGTWGMIWG